jgi:hypothetical protein
VPERRWVLFFEHSPHDNNTSNDMNASHTFGDAIITVKPLSPYHKIDRNNPSQSSLN